MLNRLLGIIYILLNKGTVTAAELAERFEVSVRTVYRDIDALGMAGIPVYTRKGKNGGISLTEQFVLDKMLVSREEQLQILAALGSLEAVGAQQASEILSKLGDFFQVKPYNWVEIDLSDWSGSRQELYRLIRDAIWNRRVLEFDYYGQHREMTHRTAEPVQLLFKEYTWYLRAWCRTRKAMRLFKLLRMKRVAETGETFPERLRQEEAFWPKAKEAGGSLTESAPGPRAEEAGGSIPEDAPEPKAEGKEGENIPMEGQSVPAREPACRIVMRIDASESYRVYDRYREEEIEVLPDGSFRVTVCYELDDWVYGHILSFGPAAYVLEPEQVRREIGRRIGLMQMKYQENSL